MSVENGDSGQTGAVVKIDEREKKSKDKSQTRDSHSNRDDNFDLNTEINFDGSEEIIRLPEDYADPDREPLETAYGMPFPARVLHFILYLGFLIPNLVTFLTFDLNAVNHRVISKPS